MKARNLLNLAIFLIVAIAAGCNEYDPVQSQPVPDDNTNKPTNVIGSFMSANAPTTQTFVRDASNFFSLTSENGYVYSFPKGVLRDAQGITVEGNVDVEITEFTSNSDMIYSGVTTTSGDQLLQSGGMFKIDISQDGEPLTVNGSYNVRVPATNVQNDMRVFQGSETVTESGDTIIDWVLQDSSNWSTDSLRRNYVLNLNFLSWCNLDRYYNAPTGSSVHVKLPDGFTNKNASAFIIFDENSVASLFSDPDNEEFNSGLYRLPLGWELQILVVANDDDQMYYGLRSSTVVENHLETFDDLTKVTKENLKEIIENL